MTGAAPLPSRLPPAPVWIVAGCILFNFVLCFVNTRLAPISPVLVMLCEAVLVIPALFIGFSFAGRDKLYWLVILLLQGAVLLLLSVVKDELLLQPLRNVIIIPVFILLGLAAAQVKFTRPLLALTLFVAAVGLFEALRVDDFLKLFNIKNYYIAKGADNDFSFTNSDLFVSGVRPTGRFLLNIGNLHRISSVFLEPVSLGFFAFAAGLYFIAMRDRMRRRIYYAGLALACLLIWLADARMALGAFVLSFALRPLFARLDHRLSVLVFPAFFTLFLALYLSGIIHVGGEGLGTRISEFLHGLSLTDTEILLGTGRYDPPTVTAANSVTVDSALLNLLQNQGIAGFLLFWLPPLLFRRAVPREARIYLFGLSVFLSFGFMISSAIFTIKTAALLWFQYGYIIASCNKALEETA